MSFVNELLLIKDPFNGLRWTITSSGDMLITCDKVIDNELADKRLKQKFLGGVKNRLIGKRFLSASRDDEEESTYFSDEVGTKFIFTDDGEIVVLSPTGQEIEDITGYIEKTKIKYEKLKDGRLLVRNNLIFGDIVLDKDFSDLALTEEKARLAFISQTGFAYYQFPNHRYNNRFEHCVTALKVLESMIDRIAIVAEPHKIEITNTEMQIAKYAIFEHDNGHAPFSHSAERFIRSRAGNSNYSHEERAIDILSTDTGTGKVLKKALLNLDGDLSYDEKFKLIEDSISGNNAPSTNDTFFTRILKQLVSYQIDADRIAYLLMDSALAGIDLGIDFKRLVSSIGVTLNNNNRTELVFDISALNTIENIFISRAQMYRGVYYCKASQVLERHLHNFAKVLDDETESEIEFSDNIKEFLRGIESNDLNSFLMSTDDTFMEAFKIVRERAKSDMHRYAFSDDDLVNDFIIINSDSGISEENIIERLSHIFKGKDLTNLSSLFSSSSKIKIYSRGEEINIYDNGVVKKLSEVSDIIKSLPEVIFLNRIYFNPVMLRMELGFTEEEFSEYKLALSELLEDINKKPKEFELKYIVGDNEEEHLLERIQGAFIREGFRFERESDIINADEYFDTDESSLLATNSSFRIRKRIRCEREGRNDEYVSYRATFKQPENLGKGEKLQKEQYSSRDELEVDLFERDFFTATTEIAEKLAAKNIEFDINALSDDPKLFVTTTRQNFILEKQGIRLRLSWDESIYSLDSENEIADKMIEIEVIDGPNTILNAVNLIMQNEFEFTPTQDSKYLRGCSLVYSEAEYEMSEFEA